MVGVVGVNDYNLRYCYFIFVCCICGVMYGLVGYFEFMLYEFQMEESKGQKVEISIYFECIDEKSKDMILWFFIFFFFKVSKQMLFVVMMCFEIDIIK